MMSGGGLIWLVITALVVVAFWRILPRAGLSQWLALAAIIPFGAVILLLVLAFRPWPGDHPGGV